jgi:hypothetical protein
VDWLPVNAITAFNVRADDKFIASVSNGDTSYVHVGGTAASSYVVRYRSGGANVDIDCVAVN